MEQRIEKMVLNVGQYIYLGDWLSLNELFIKHHSMNVNQMQYWHAKNSPKTIRRIFASHIQNYISFDSNQLLLWDIILQTYSFIW